VNEEIEKVDAAVAHVDSHQDALDTLDGSRTHVGQSCFGAEVFDHDRPDLGESALETLSHRHDEALVSWRVHESTIDQCLRVQGGGESGRIAGLQRLRNVRPELLDRALADAGRPISALLFTSPNNPLGWVYEAREIDEIIDWADRQGIHVIFDEVYALSVYGERTFVSAASRIGSLGRNVHVVWAFSKDFGASGLRAGVLLSENEAVLEAIDGLAYWSAVSGHTQYLLGEMVADEAWIDAYRIELRTRLAMAADRVTAALEHAHIPHVPAGAGIFVLCDLRPFMIDATWEEEDLLWRRILNEANVNLTPGSACHVGEPGWMRLCFAAVPTETAVAGIRRVGDVLRSG